MLAQSWTRYVTTPTLRLAPFILAGLLVLSFALGMLVTSLPAIRGTTSGANAAVPAAPFDAAKFRAEERAPLSQPGFDPVQFRSDEKTLR
jgi:hypothetical protein